MKITSKRRRWMSCHCYFGHKVILLHISLFYFPNSKSWILDIPKLFFLIMKVGKQKIWELIRLKCENDTIWRFSKVRIEGNMEVWVVWPKSYFNLFLFLFSHFFSQCKSLIGKHWIESDFLPSYFLKTPFKK